MLSPYTGVPAGSELMVKEALRLAINKLPIKCKIVSRETEGQE